MTIHLSKELEKFVHDAVSAGLYAREEDVIRDALIRLERTMSGDTEVANQDAKVATASEEKRLVDALNQRLIAVGLVIQLPDPAQDTDDDDGPDDQPIEIEGEPLSETIIRERR